MKLPCSGCDLRSACDLLLIALDAGVVLCCAVNIEKMVCDLIAHGRDGSESGAAAPTASGAGSGGSDMPLIIEGRQPAVMATYMTRVLRKTRTLRIYLSCCVREQALRFICREGGGTEAANKLRSLLPDKHYTSLSAVHADISKLVGRTMELTRTTRTNGRWS